MGRPREFDEGAALDRALEVFWRRGYEGATLPDLTEAMGINRPSLYAAFGCKEELFRRALERYARGPAGYVAEALAAPTARAAVELLLRGAAELLADPERPGGCLVVQAALACGTDAEPVRAALAATREAGVCAIRARLETAKRAGELPATTDCANLARFVATVLHGMSVEAASGAPREQLQGVVEIALRAWPA